MLTHLSVDDIHEKPRSRTRTGASSFTFFPVTRPRAESLQMPSCLARAAEKTKGPDRDLYYVEKARLAAEQAAREVTIPPSFKPTPP